MLQRNLTESTALESVVWRDLTQGVPTIAALAQLCGHAMCEMNSSETSSLEGLSAESRAILFQARESGAISIRGDKNAFEPGQRYLAVCVEQPEGSLIEFRFADNPELTVRFMDGFRQLCARGLAMHHMMNEFSLTAQGFELARKVDPETLAALLPLSK